MAGGNAGLATGAAVERDLEGVLLAGAGFAERNELAVVRREIGLRCRGFPKTGRRAFGGCFCSARSSSMRLRSVDGGVGRLIEGGDSLKGGGHGGGKVVVRKVKFRAQIRRRSGLFELGDPVGERLVEVDITLDDGDERLGSESGEALVEIVATLAEVRVIRITECEYGEIDRFEGGASARGARSGVGRRCRVVRPRHKWR